MASGTPFRMRQSTLRGSDVLRGAAAFGVGVTADVHGTMAKGGLNTIRRRLTKVRPVDSNVRRS